MNPNEHPQDPLDIFLAEAREAASRADSSPRDFGFETRLMARLDERSQFGFAAPWRLRLLWNALAGTAAVVGFVFFWASNSGALDLHGEESTWALWGGADASLNLFPD